MSGLSSEHHAALSLARSLRRSETWEDGDAARLRERFACELEPHFRIEETILLPALTRLGETAMVERTRRDHATIRALVVRAGDGVHSAARELGRLLEAHVRFEERELFPLCEACLSTDVLDEVGRRAPKA